MGFSAEGIDVKMVTLGVVAVGMVTLDIPVDADVTVVMGVQRFVDKFCPSWFSIIELSWGGVLFMCEDCVAPLST